MKNKLLFISAAAGIAISVAAAIDISNLDNYAAQTIPQYITKDNTQSFNPITDKGATLGRVLFYDRSLSLTNTISCGSCHIQQFAFGDTTLLSKGHASATTGRHAMRLVNARFSDEQRFFWDERANSLEDQTTRPVRDHNEMGFSGANGNPDFDSLVRKMNTISYYKPLFTWVFGDSTITEDRFQRALAQFVRSIQSFDSKFDTGLAMVANINQPFPNFSQLENQGKQLFLAPPPQGGAGCQGCHRAPEFDIDPASGNNGVVAVAGNGSALDLTNTRAPSLRNLFNPSGSLNGPLMHNGVFSDIQQVIDHYNQIVIVPGNTGLDQRLTGPGGVPQNLNLTTQQKAALEAFLLTLTGHDVFTNPKWSDPFDANGVLDISGLPTSVKQLQAMNLKIYPNPATDYVEIHVPIGDYSLEVYTASGARVMSRSITGNSRISLASFAPGIYTFQLADMRNKLRDYQKVLVK